MYSKVTNIYIVILTFFFIFFFLQLTTMASFCWVSDKNQYVFFFLFNLCFLIIWFSKKYNYAFILQKKTTSCLQIWVFGTESLTRLFVPRFKPWYQIQDPFKDIQFFYSKHTWESGNFYFLNACQCISKTSYIAQKVMLKYL